LTSEHVRHFFRKIDDHTVLEILALQPTHAQLEEAATKAIIGSGEIFADRGSEHPIVTKIIELVGTDMDRSGEREP
jgi:hypothetical protein